MDMDCACSVGEASTELDSDALISASVRSGMLVGELGGESLDEHVLEMESVLREFVLLVCSDQYRWSMTMTVCRRSNAWSV